MENRFTGMVAIVTGGASGIGRATCRRLAAEGAAVVVADIDGPAAQAVADELGDGASACRFDAADVSSIENLVSTAVGRHGRLDILHNNAAIVSPQIHARDTTALAIDFDTWDLVMAVNVRGYLAGCKFAIPHMLANGGGTIVNTASCGGLSGDPSRIAYNVSKAAVLGLTRQIATQHGPQGIRCNAVAPGLILTPAVRAVAADVVEVMGRHILTQEFGEPEDVASLVCFLASGEARYINGQTYVIDGGMLAHNPAYADLLAFARSGKGAH